MPESQLVPTQTHDEVFADHRHSHLHTRIDRPGKTYRLSADTLLDPPHHAHVHTGPVASCSGRDQVGSVVLYRLRSRPHARFRGTASVPRAWHRAGARREPRDTFRVLRVSRIKIIVIFEQLTAISKLVSIRGRPGTTGFRTTSPPVSRKVCSVRCTVRTLI